MTFIYPCILHTARWIQVTFEIQELSGHPLPRHHLKERWSKIAAVRILWQENTMKYVLQPPGCARKRFSEKIVFAKSPRPCAAEAFRCSKVMWTKFNRKWTMQFWELPRWCCIANSDSKVASRACSELFVMYWRFNSILVHVHALCCPEAESYPLNLMADQFQFYCPYWKTNPKKKQFFSPKILVIWLKTYVRACYW